MEPYWESVERIIKESDIVLEILDARLVEASRNAHLEMLIKKAGRPRILVVNKADLVSRKALEACIDKLKQEVGEIVVYFSNKKRNTARNLLAKIRQVFSEHGKRAPSSTTQKRAHREARGDIVIGVVGYPNVGKSSIINALSFKKKAPVSSKAGTTHGIHWITAGRGVKMIDTPGVIPLSRMDESVLGLISSRGPEKLKDADVVAGKIIGMFADSNKAALENFYGIKIESENPYEILETIALKRGHLKKGGEADEARTAAMIVRDWQTGKLRL